MLDRNEQEQRSSQREQDGSEVKSVDLERLITEGQTMMEQRNAFEIMRDIAAEHYGDHTRSAWRPYVGSLANRQTLTAAIIDSRDYLKAKKQADTETFIPSGTLIALSGGPDYQDHNAIWAALDKVHGRHADTVLMHGGGTKGAELIAAKWADNRGIQQVVFKPDWTRHNRAAPFKRNDQMLAQNPAGIIIFPGNGVTENLADKANAQGIKVYRPVKSLSE